MVLQTGDAGKDMIVVKLTYLVLLALDLATNRATVQVPVAKGPAARDDFNAHAQSQSSLTIV